MNRPMPVHSGDYTKSFVVRRMESNCNIHRTRAYRSLTVAPPKSHAQRSQPGKTWRILQSPSWEAAAPRPLQFTNRRSRTLFTSPSIKKIDKMFDPPALMRGSGIPVTGMRPTTIPTFTNRWNNKSVATPMQM
jgi:hypothetical protein